MTTQIGFGKAQLKQQKAKKNKAKRAAASRQYNQMKKSGLPEFNIYVRIQGQETWYPVGAMTVNRTSQINQALFAQEEELLKGVFHLFPKLRKYQNHLEYGHRLKEFSDEPIEIAVRPKPTAPGWLGSTLASVNERLSPLLKRR